MQNTFLHLDPFIRSKAMETFADRIDVFNSVTNGAFQLSTEAYAGDKSVETYFRQIQNSTLDVDIFGTNDSVASQKFTEVDYTKSIKFHTMLKPFAWTAKEYARLLDPESDQANKMAIALGEGMLYDNVAKAVGALVGAIGNNASLVNDVSASSSITQLAINDSLHLFGDRRSSLGVTVAHSSFGHALIEEQIQNGNHLFMANDIGVYDVQGVPTVIMDLPFLIDANNANIHTALHLQTGAVIIDNTGQLETNLETSNGKKMIERTYQAEWSAGMQMRGYEYDVLNGGLSPTIAELTTGSNWIQHVASIKDTAGVLTRYDISK